MKNITYILGAGASFNAVPVINHLQTFMGDNRTLFMDRVQPHAYAEFGLTNFIAFPELSKTQINLDWEPLSILSNCLDYFSDKAKAYQTIDTFALSIKKGDSTNYELLKFVLNIFFSYWENGENVKYINPISKQHYIEIDERYIYLASEIFLNNNMELKIPDNMNFITWNYDTQLERALMLFLDEDKRNLNELNKYVPIYPLCPIEDAKIIHINGISGGFVDYRNRFETFQIDANSLIEYKMKHLAEVMKSLINKGLLKSNLNFIWDNDEEEFNKKRRFANRMIQLADEISIIGYSFPEFNRKFDNLILDINPDKKIYIQNPSFDSNKFKEYFGAKFQNVSNLPIDKFYIPNEFYL